MCKSVYLSPEFCYLTLVITHIICEKRRSRARILEINKKGSIIIIIAIIIICVSKVQSKSFIWVTSKYLGSCWSYRKTKTTLLYQTTHSASNEPSQSEHRNSAL